MGCDFISGSGATAVFIMESGIPKGLHFASVFSVGNSAQISVEDILEYMDETFDPKHSSRVKLLYLESIQNPDKLLKHASSLIRKGCKIAAIKAGAARPEAVRQLHIPGPWPTPIWPLKLCSAKRASCVVLVVKN